MWRRRDRARAELAGALRQELEEVRHDLAASWNASLAALRHAIASERDEARWRVAENDAALNTALERVADALDEIAASLDADRRDRRVHLDAVEFLLRDMVIGLAEPAAAPPIVLGGSIDPDALEPHPRLAREIDLRDPPLTVGTAVEVHSHFHDRWVTGFEIIEIVHERDRWRYRLTRLSDRRPLPLLFDTPDVRPAAALRHITEASLPSAPS